MSLLYCYGIVGEDVELDVVGLEGNNIITIPFKDIFAMISVVSEENFSQKAIDQNVKNMEWLTKKAPLHEEVVTAIMEKTTILPMKFCTIFTSKEKVEEMLEEKYADAKYYLDYVKGKVEMNVKVYCNLAEMRKQVKEESPDLQKLDEEIAGKPPGQAYFLQQKIDLLLKDKVSAKISAKKKVIIEKLKEMGDLKQNDLLAKKLTGKDMVLNTALLLRKEVIEKLQQLVGTLKVEFPLCEFEISGPFAPYDFIR